MITTGKNKDEKANAIDISNKLLPSKVDTITLLITQGRILEASEQTAELARLTSKLQRILQGVLKGEQ